MSTKNYNKLVRDRIPDIINSKGNIAVTRTLTHEEFAKCLNEKLTEEIQEFLLTNDIEELADVFQVILAILDERGISFEQFEKLRQQKALKNGEFKERIFLTCVVE